MISLDDLRRQIESDSNVDITRLDEESVRIPQLHSKYYQMMMEEAKTLRGMEMQLAMLRLRRQDYYLGRLDDAAYKEEPLYRKVIKSELEPYLEADEKLNRACLKVAEQKDKVKMMEEFIRNINQRSFNIRNAIEFLKFKNGQ